MTHDPFSMWDEPGGSFGDFLGDAPPSTGIDLGYPLSAEPEEVEVRDAEGRIVGTIDLS